MLVKDAVEVTNPQQANASKPIYALLSVKAPVISATASPDEPVLKKVYEYDLPTVKGQRYRFHFLGL